MVKKEQLTDLGFSEKEASVYLSLLELGPSTTTEISRLAGINRTTGYDILEGLAGEGLVSPVGDAKVQKFAAENPEKVISYLENKIRESEQKLRRANALLPELLSMYTSKERPKVKFYEGAERMKEAFEDTLKAKGEILAYAVGFDMYQSVGKKYFEDYTRKKVAKNIRVRVIAPDDESSREIVSKDAEELRESVLVPKDRFYFSTEKNIYNDKILIVSWKEKFAVIIESAEMASAERNIFELSWAGAKGLQATQGHATIKP